MRTTAFVAAGAALARAAVPADLVTTLPGFGTPLSNLYSGYVLGGAGKRAWRAGGR